MAFFKVMSIMLEDSGENKGFAKTACLRVGPRSPRLPSCSWLLGTPHLSLLSCSCPDPGRHDGNPCIVSSHVQLGLEGDSGRSRHPYNCNYTSPWVSLEFPTVASISSALLCLTENGTYHDLPPDWVSRVGAAGHEGTSPNPLSQDQPSFFPALQGKLSWKGARTASTAWGDPSHPQAAIPGISRWIAWL